MAIILAFAASPKLLKFHPFQFRWSVCTLLNKTILNAYVIWHQAKQDDEYDWQVVMVLQGSGHGIYEGTTLAFTWRNWEKPQETS